MRGIARLHVECHLARHVEQLDLESAAAAVDMVRLEWPFELYRLSADAVFGEHAEDRIGLQHGEHPLAALDGERLTFAQMEEPGDRIDIGAGEDNAFDRRGTQISGWMKDLMRLDLLAKIGRSVDQEPPLAIAAQR